jgi:hypothetical protein
MKRPTPKRLAIGIAVALALGFARCHWDRLTEAQTPRETFDSQIYIEIAERPIGFDLLVTAKPPTVPLIYRAIGDDPPLIAGVQAELAFFAWAILGIALAYALRRWWLRAVAIGVTTAFLLAAPRVGWTGVVLSESIADSLMALLAACAIGLTMVAPAHAKARILTAPAAHTSAPARRDPNIPLAPDAQARLTHHGRRGLEIALGVVAVAWMFARDTNAIAGIVAIVAAAIVWPVRGWWRRARSSVAIAAIAGCLAIVTLVASRVVPAPLPFQQSWYEPLTARQSYLLVDNVLIRMMADREWLADRGAPVDELAKFVDTEGHADKLVQRVPENRLAQDWIADHGNGTYLRWLVSHPIDRIGELIGARWTILAANHAATMPAGWLAHDGDHPVVELVRRLTTNRWLLLALLLASPAMLLAPRRDPRCGVALCMIASGLVAAAASYYGDAVELARHCYGAGQQIVLGLFVAALCVADRSWRAQKSVEN